MNFQHVFDPTVCRANDIRGVVGETLTANDAYAVGRGVATMARRAGGREVAVGRDGRESSSVLFDAVCGGIADAGVNAVGIGLGPSPMLYFATHHLGVGGGIMVTGSHNPPNYNGFKLLMGTRTFQPDQMLELQRILASGDVSIGKGEIVERPVREQYIATLLERIGPLGERCCAWDPGNGAVGEVLEDVLLHLPGRHFAINVKVDGSFPAHHPDPSEPRNLIEIRDLVMARNCDIGFAFDGDGDRLGVVDRRGHIIWPDQYLGLLARSVLGKNPGATIIADVKASDVLFDMVRNEGGQPDMWKTGHAFVKQRMLDAGAPLAGEMSGHVFFADNWFGFDDALYASLRLLEALESYDIEIDAFFDQLPHKANTPEIRVPCDDNEKFKVVDEISRLAKAAGGEVIDIDGVRALRDDGWWLLRASNTEPALVVRCEGNDDARLSRMKDELASLLAKIGIDAVQLYGDDASAA